MIKILLNGMEVNIFIACLIWACIGVLISLLINACYRNQNSPATPVKFSFKFLLNDNWKRLLLSFILIIPSIIFSKEIIGSDPSTFVSFGIGLGWDKLIEKLINKYEFLSFLKGH